VQRPPQNRELMILFSMLWLKHRRITSGNGGGSRHGHINSSTAKAWKQSAHVAGHGYSCRSNFACPVILIKNYCLSTVQCTSNPVKKCPDPDLDGWLRPCVSRLGCSTRTRSTGRRGHPPAAPNIGRVNLDFFS
jgi:hypothetical protein